MSVGTDNPLRGRLDQRAERELVFATDYRRRAGPRLHEGAHCRPPVGHAIRPLGEPAGLKGEAGLGETLQDTAAARVSPVVAVRHPRD